MTRSSIAILLIVGFLAGCAITRDTDKVKAVPQTGDAFQKILFDQYITLAEMERAEFDWDDNIHFNKKALLAAQGVSPAPDLINSRALPENKLAEMTAAHDELVGYLDAGAGAQLPQEAATAQAQFDCWVQELEENIPSQKGDIDACRKSFKAAMTILKENMQADTFVLLPNRDGTAGKISVGNKAGQIILDKARLATKVGSSAPSKAFTLSQDEINKLFGKALAAQSLPPRKFILYFLPNSNDLDAASTALLPGVLTEITKRTTYDLSVIGHTDRVGSVAYNAKLSKARAVTVKALLVGKGVDGGTIEVTSHSENNPLVPTKDGVAEPRNRRVEITVR